MGLGPYLNSDGSQTSISNEHNNGISWIQQRKERKRERNRAFARWWSALEVEEMTLYKSPKVPTVLRLGIGEEEENFFQVFFFFLFVVCGWLSPNLED